MENGPAEFHAQGTKVPQCNLGAGEDHQLATHTCLHLVPRRWDSWH